MLPALNREATRNNQIPDAVVPLVLDPAMFRFLNAQLALPFTLLLEVTQSPSNGLVTIMLVASSVSPGPLPLSPIPTLPLIHTSKRSAATKLEAVTQMILPILTEETQDLLMDLPEPALTPLPSLLT